MKDYPEKRNSQPDRRPPRHYDPFHDPFFDMVDDFFKPMFYNEPDRMRTDICENDDSYVIDIELPGFDKKDINVSLEDGYLTVSAQKSGKQDDSSEKDKSYVLKECTVSCRRSYYVGENIEHDSIKAKYKDGILSLTVPKEKPKKLPSSSIEIE